MMMANHYGDDDDRDVNCNTKKYYLIWNQAMLKRYLKANIYQIYEPSSCQEQLRNPPNKLVIFQVTSQVAQARCLWAFVAVERNK